MTIEEQLAIATDALFTIGQMSADERELSAHLIARNALREIESGLEAGKEE